MKFPNKIFYEILFLFACLIISGTVCQKAQKLPNVLLISLDDCRADHLSCQGYHRKTSPFIDKVASGGILFSNAFVNTHGTPPSHTTILSSLYQETHKVDYYLLDRKEKPSHRVPTQIVMLQEILKGHGYTTLGVTGGGFLARVFGFDRGFDEYNDLGGGVELESRRLVKLVKKYHSTGKPIFAFYHTYEIHSPYFPPERYRNIFGEYSSRFVPSSENLRSHNLQWNLSGEDLEFIKSMYDAGIRFTDDTLRAMFNELTELGFFDNCLVLITADHGEEFGEHGGLLHRSYLYDELLHVPLIISGTGLPKGKIIRQLVSTVDIVPTILGNLGIKAQTPIMGCNLLASRSPSDEEEEAVFSQYGNLRYSIRTNNWKFIQNPDTIELFDLRKDPQEHKNLAEEFPDLVTHFRGRIHKWKTEQPNLNIEPHSELNLDKESIKKLKSLGYIQ